MLGGLVAGSGVAGCAPRDRAPGGGVLAAGQPAAVLIWSLAPERLMGWPRRPAPAALAALPAAAGVLPELGALASGGAPANLEAMAALRPSLVIDYGDIEPAYVALGRRLETRLGADWRLIDGALTASPQAMQEAGRLLRP